MTGSSIVAGDNGVFTAKAGTSRWSRLGRGLPQVRIYDLDLDRSGRHLSVAVYGRGAWVLDLGAKARTSTAGPSQLPRTSVPQPTSGHLAATGPTGALPWASLGLLLGGLLLVRRRRTA